jgi:hypothetical protein
MMGGMAALFAAMSEFCGHRMATNNVAMSEFCGHRMATNNVAMPPLSIVNSFHIHFPNICKYRRRAPGEPAQPLVQRGPNSITMQLMFCIQHSYTILPPERPALHKCMAGRA